MKALILAAGLGTRLRPLTNNKPKCLLSINGQPLLDIWIKKITKCPIDEIFINTHYLSNQVNVFIKKMNYPYKVKLLFEKELLGTAGTIKKNLKLFLEDDLLLIHGDNLMQDDLSEIINSHYNRPSECLMTMLTFQTNTPHTCGIVEIDENKIIKSFVEKPKNSVNRRANGAIYILSPDMLQELKKESDNVFNFSEEIIPKYINKIYTYHTDKNFIDIGTEESFKKAQEFE